MTSLRNAPEASYRSSSSDDTNGDRIYNREMADSLRSILAGRKLDIIGFDACLMAMLETAFEMKDIADYMVFSQELEPARGWDYEDWLRVLRGDPTQDARRLASNLVESYKRTYSEGARRDPETTLSAVNLNETQDLAIKVSRLGVTVENKLDKELQNVIDARASCMNYAPGNRIYHIDIARFLDQLTLRTSDADIKRDVKLARDALTKMVTANYAGSDRGGSFGSNGLAIYFASSEAEYLGDPWSEGGYEQDNTFFPVKYVQEEKWDNFLHQFWKRVP